ncbi:putative pectinesterase [Dioscorea sansibarensis]
MFTMLTFITTLLLFIHSMSITVFADTAIPANPNSINQWLLENTNPVRPQLNAQLAQAELYTRVITVNKYGKGDFKNITDAVNSIPVGNKVRTIIKIAPGIYYEKILIDFSRPFVTLYGDPNAMPRISFNGTAKFFTTYNSATVAVESDHFMACNIIFDNTAPRPIGRKEGAQAVAMRISGQMAAFYNCRFYGHQDTLLDHSGTHFFKDCFIRGSTDFIFGRDAIGFGVITAQGRELRRETSGFIFAHCLVSGSGNLFLGRAWRQRSRVVYAYTSLPSNLDPKGWDDMRYPDHQRTVFYGEYKCMGPGAVTNQRVNYSRVLTDRQAKHYLDLNFIYASTWLLPPPKL